MRVALTRPDGQNEELAARLRRAGHEVGVHPLIAIEPLGDDPVGLDGYDWLVVTSANGAVELARRAVGRPARIAAVGDATAAVLREAGFDVDLIPARSSQEGLLEELPASPGRVLLAAASDARTLLLERTGADHVALYRTRELRPKLAHADMVVLASGSAARALAAIRTDLPVVTIGPVTTRAARAAGLVVRAEAASQDAQGLVDAIGRAGG